MTSSTLGNFAVSAHKTRSGDFGNDRFKTIISPPISIPPSFSLDTRIKFALIPFMTGRKDKNFSINDVRCFRTTKRVYHGAVSASFAEFPSPFDTHLQPIGSPDASDREGQFLNHIEFHQGASGIYNAPGMGGTYYEASANPAETLEAALSHGAWLPASGIPQGPYGYASLGVSSLQKGLLNQWGVITKDGYVLEQKKRLRSTTTENYRIGDSSCGVLVSSVPSDPSVVRYILSVSANQVDYWRKHYGGIETIGLWMLDPKATAKKFGKLTGTSELGKPPYLRQTSPLTEASDPIVDSADPFVTGGINPLYNLRNPEWDPVFRLFSKKVFFPGGLKIHPDSKFMTIIWSIKL
mgnify:CR=1 FL=1